MFRTWTHVGRLWTDGEPFLAMDGSLRSSWCGFSDKAQYSAMCALGPDVTEVAVGAGLAAIIATDGEVEVEGWHEVFVSGQDTLAVVQVSGGDYRQLLTAALDYPDDEDQAGAEVVAVGGGELMVFSSALDGAGAVLVPPVAGQVPVEHGTFDRADCPTDPGLLLPFVNGEYRLRVRWVTWLDESDEARFARWVLAPVQPRGMTHRAA